MSRNANPHNNLPDDILALATRVLGSRSLARSWFQRPAVALDGRRPSELLSSEEGIRSVRELLLRIEYGVYT